MTARATWTSHEDSHLIDRCPAPAAMPWLDEAWFAAKGIRDAPFNAAEAILNRGGAPRDPDRVALITSDGDWTYADLEQSVAGHAACLREELSIRPGSGVVLQLRNGPYLIATLFAVLRAGGVAILCSPLLTDAEVGEIVARTRARLWLGNTDKTPDAGDRCRYLAIDALVALSRQTVSSGAPFVLTAPTDPAIILFSSGSVGKPKACVQYHRELVTVSESYGRYVVPVGPGDITVGSASFCFAYGLESSVLMPLYHGATSIVLYESGPLDMLRAVQAHRATHFYSIPALYRVMAGVADRFDLESLRYCVSAGENITPELVALWLRACGVTIADGLGNTEFNSFLLASPPSQAPPGALGQVVPGFQARILAEDGSEAAPGESGRLAVRGPNGCKYFDNLADQEKHVVAGWTLTGDICRRSEEGFYWHQGRIDDLINRGGIKVSAIEIERAIRAHSQVADCAVVGVFDPGFQTSTVRAFVSLKEDVMVQDAARLLRPWLLQRLAPHKVPDTIISIPQIPRNPNGKIQRFKLLHGSPEAGRADATETDI